MYESLSNVLLLTTVIVLIFFLILAIRRVNLLIRTVKNYTGNSYVSEEPEDKDKEEEVKIPKGATYMSNGVYYRKGPGRYAMYYHKGWRESGNVTNSDIEGFTKIDLF